MIFTVKCTMFISCFNAGGFYDAERLRRLFRDAAGSDGGALPRRRSGRVYGELRGGRRDFDARPESASRTEEADHNGIGDAGSQMRQTQGETLSTGALL